MTDKRYARIKAGEIWWVDLSSILEDTRGHETQKLRPCLVVANCSEAEMLMIIPFQSNLDAKRLPHTYIIKQHPNNGLKRDSVVMGFQMRAIDYERITEYSGTVNYTDLNRIRIIIKNYLNIK